MSGYQEVIEHPFRVYVGEEEQLNNYDGTLVTTGIAWTYKRSFLWLSAAQAHANLLASCNQYVKIEKKETE